MEVLESNNSYNDSNHIYPHNGNQNGGIQHGGIQQGGNRHGSSSGPDYGDNSEPEGGRFEFDDGGKYCGGWAEGKAHGFGVCTAPKRQGHFSGEWNLGFEVCGVYVWPNGNTFEGQWSGGKRSGLGIETKGRWIYRGEWTQGYKGRYGIRTSAASGARYEGTWTTGVQDGYGMETYADGGTYRGQWKDGMRHGYGVRQSAPYNLAAQYRKKTGSTGLDSLDIKDSTADSEFSSTADFLSRFNTMSSGNKGGFALKASRSASLDQRANSRSGSVPPTPSSGASPDIRRRNMSDFPQRASLRMRIANTLHLKPPGSRSRSNDENGVLNAKLSTLPNAPPLRRVNNSNYSTLSSNAGYYGNDGTVGSMRSTASLDSDHSILTDNTDTSFISQDGIPEDSAVVETYAGEWKHDKRCGYGVSERSDGVKYEGEWFNNKMNGYGVTTLPDGTREEGKYRDNELVIRTGMSRAAMLLPMRSSKQRQRIEEAVSRAVRAAHEAMQRTEVTLQRVMMARSKAKSADIAAAQARADADLAERAAKLFENIPLRIEKRSGEVDYSSGHSSNEKLNGDGRHGGVGVKEGQTPKRTRSFIARVFSAGKGDKKTRPNIVDRSKLKSAGSDDPLTRDVGSVSRQNSRSRYVRKPRAGREEGRENGDRLDYSSHERLGERPHRTPSPKRLMELLNTVANAPDVTNTSHVDRSTNLLRNGPIDGRINGYENENLLNGRVPTINTEYVDEDYIRPTTAKVQNSLPPSRNIGQLEQPRQNGENVCNCGRALCVCSTLGRNISSLSSSQTSDVTHNSNSPYSVLENKNYYRDSSNYSDNSDRNEIGREEFNNERLKSNKFNDGYSYGLPGNAQSSYKTSEGFGVQTRKLYIQRNSSHYGPYSDRNPSNPAANTRPYEGQGQTFLESSLLSVSTSNQTTCRRRNSQPDMKVVEVPRSGPLTWEQLTALSQQRQQELRKERERQNKSGVVVVLSLGGLKEWVMNHQFLAFVVAFNIGLVFLFLRLISA